MLKKILKVLFLADKRKGNRNHHKNLNNVILLFNGKVYSISNLSEKGLGIFAPDLGLFVPKQMIKAELEFDMSERVHIKAMVVRVKKHDIGLEILEAGKNFKGELQKLSK